ncbi:phosphatase PAP2 family protein [Formosa haliotis]|uniref:phosphatase PAP2 family protein n=1 Tax=Formosa haliotis TaxID=1555194 RepID=UPI000825B89A|nr:phosphatase PAP2 family protein [Formosa haliotis]
MLEQLINTDKELFLYLNNLGSASWDTFWLVITNKFTFIPFYALLLFLLYKKLGVKSVLILVILIALMITFTDQIANVFKHGFQRPRPCRQEGVMESMRFIAERCGRYGFFSAHAASSMAIAVFMGLVLKPFYKNLIFVFLFWSAIVAYSRIYVGVHYPLDIICGMAFGGLTGFGFYKLFLYISKRRGLPTF